ncbi:MAG: tetratricopeptide repeat protein [Pegethrix bostrychoides GSE-TBD4-15B]|uniref:Tetratricopeptide repeat protein n=1 Tax=Pegethrix bostrychoides GSE-TBD4-15B TaxID=2839662 RepID=A0A951P8B6_9CYAN|nr:tetratricopeptide repeat protein [Pegethrix bostrychoides GSE-TBD4-15B]
MLASSFPALSGQISVTADASSAAAFCELAADLLRHGQSKMAVDYCHLAIQAQPTAQSYKLLGDGLQKLKQWVEAEAAYQQALQLAPDWAELHANLGTLYMQQQQWLKALEFYQKALSLKPELPEIQGRLKQLLGQVAAANQAANQAANDAVNRVSVIEAPKQNAAATPLPVRTSEAAYQAYQAGNSALQLRQWPEAMRHYQQAIQLDPNFAMAHWRLALSLEAMGEQEQAVERYFLALSLQPNLAKPAELCKFGQLFVQREKLEQALSCYEWALGQDDQLAAAHGQMGLLLGRLERYEAAAEHYRRAVELEPAGSFCHGLGDVWTKLQRWQAAAAAYRQAIELEPEFSWSHNNLGDALMQLAQWEAAATAYQKAIELNPEFHWSHYNLGEALAKLGQWDTAIGSYHRALELQPQEDWIGSRVGASHFNEGIERITEGNIKEANLCFHQIDQIGDSGGNLIHWPQQQDKVWPFYSCSHLQSVFETLKPQNTAWPKITIVTPSLNQGAYIEETILSILNQNYSNLEYIIIDGGSTDQTLRVLERYKAKITRIVVEPDQGQSNAINKGFRLGTGELMSWVNSDDLLGPGALYVLALSYLQRHWDLAAGICVAHREGKILTVRKPRTEPQNFTVEHLTNLSRLWATGHFFYQPEVSFTRRLWEQVGAGLDESLTYAMDYDLWMRFAQVDARLELVSWPLAFFRNHSAQKTADQVSSMRELLQVTERYHSILPSLERRQAIGNILEAFLLSRKRVLVIQSAENKVRQSAVVGTYHLTLCTDLEQIRLDDFDAVLLIVDSPQTVSAVEKLVQEKFSRLRLAWFWSHQQDFERNAAIADRVDVCVPSSSLLAETLRSYFSILCSEVPALNAASATVNQLAVPLESIWQQLVALLAELKQGGSLYVGSAITRSPSESAARRPHALRNEAVKQLPSSQLSVYQKLGDAYAATQNLEAAISVYQTALKLDPNQLDTRAKLNQATVIQNAKLKQSQQTGRPWPYGIDCNPAPPTLPDGSPWPKISIVTPSFNQGEFIEETILSIIHQNYPNVEHVLIDGGSTDRTMQVVEQYREHFSYAVSEPDGGQSNALNKGFRQTSGEILTWLNSDDRLAPGALYGMALAFYQSKADVVAGVCQLFRDGVEIEQHLTSCVDGLLPLADLIDLERCWLKGKFFYQPEVMFTRSIWERAGGFVDESLFYSMDYELWTRFAAASAKLHVVGRAVAQYRMHPEQKTSAVDKYAPELRQTRDALRLRFNCLASEGGSPEPSRSRLRIALLNDVGTLGGAGIAHSRIGQALALAGHEVIPVAGTLDWSLTPVACAAEEVFDLVSEVNPDLVVVGNLHNMEKSVDILEKLTGQFHTVFVMHDQWLLTGRCAYVGACEKYMVACDANCPTSHEYPRLLPDQIAETFRRKHDLLLNERLLILGDSGWTTNWARYALLNYRSRQTAAELDRKFQTIYYGLDLETFHPQDVAECRRLLGLPMDRFIILTGCQSVEDERKGFKYLIEALKIAALEDVLVVSLGYGNSVVEGVEVYSAGYVSDPLLLACYYGAADIFVGPSQEEAFGQTFVEAAACGTPAVGYGVGGVKEAIADGVSGRVVVQKTPAALAKMIVELYSDLEQRQLLSRLAPVHIANRFSFQASYHTFMVALTQSGWLDKLGLNPASKFSAQGQELALPLVVRDAVPVVKHEIISGDGVSGYTLSGFGEVESPYPELGLELPSQWLLWPQGAWAVVSPQAQMLQLVIRCRNVSQGQILEVWQEEQLKMREQLAYFKIVQTNELELPVQLCKGINQFVFKVSQFQRDEAGRDLGVLIEGIELMNCSGTK